mmetsp:Transcript_14046/g.31044  ORF Transcript_14046/g.31044 Transcript_14046/m.31044 type:complete len:244 (-) Transcript_14046:103-834(-)
MNTALLSAVFCLFLLPLLLLLSPILASDAMLDKPFNVFEGLTFVVPRLYQLKHFLDLLLPHFLVLFHFQNWLVVESVIQSVHLIGFDKFRLFLPVAHRPVAFLRCYCGNGEATGWWSVAKHGVDGCLIPDRGAKTLRHTSVVPTLFSVFSLGLLHTCFVARFDITPEILPRTKRVPLRPTEGDAILFMLPSGLLASCFMPLGSPAALLIEPISCFCTSRVLDVDLLLRQPFWKFGFFQLPGRR